MADENFNSCYLSVACNRVPHCIHWGNNGKIAFGTFNSIAVTTFADGVTSPISSMLTGHKDRVNCVKWIEVRSQQCRGQQEGAHRDELVSGSTDGAIILWGGEGNKFSSLASLSGHTGSVIALDAGYVASGKNSHSRRTLVVSASTDSTVRIWKRVDRREENTGSGKNTGGGVDGKGGGGGGGGFVEWQSISFGSGFALDVALGELGSNVPVLALGGDDCRIHLYVESSEGKFVKVQSLDGHEDWIRCLEFAYDDNGDLLLASCAQDCFIRLWRISCSSSQAETSSDQIQEIQLKKNKFSISHEGGECQYSVSLESVLAGHEQWVYAVHWQRLVEVEAGKWHQPLCLLSASMDKTMIVWRFDEASGVWLDEVRVGEVGGNTLGLYGCQFGPDGKAILGHGYQGAFHVWTKTEPDQTNSPEGENAWTPSVTVSGHFAGVQDLVWSPSGDFLLSVGLDQTTRLHAPWRRDNKETWHEIARPQVHGYDMQCLAMIGEFAFVSGADEKVLRVFEAPSNFLGNLSRISCVDTSAAQKAQEAKQVPEGASVPALGLSNKAVYQGEGGMPTPDREINHPSEQYAEIYFAPVMLSRPPTEDHLLQNTLWPETQKLYGHGYEVFTVASRPDGKFVASACKAAKPEHAAILLWDTSSWQQLGQLMVHSLTVTQLAFSHDGSRLLAVSRDRTWSLFEESPSEGCPYRLIAHTDKKTSLHARIIWACSWSHDDQFFATASRDKKVIVWGKEPPPLDQSAPMSGMGNYKAFSSPLNIGDAVTAVDFARQMSNDKSYIVAVGTESGNISLHAWSPARPSSWRHLYSLPQHMTHTQTVKRLRWRPRHGEGDKPCSERPQRKDRFQLASCGADGSLRIHTFQESLFS
ncbi:elongator complex protein 2-like [Diadema antillarum]|uniref:elongator complex protein 2-like n=1 Tax=Diadema antillarum TaxID=105358 RepID=UPI003A87CF2E